jgi:hypothetical protein
MREFVTAAKGADEAPEAGPQIAFKIDGREITFNPPDTNHLVLLTAAIEASGTSASLAATMINAFFAMIEDYEDSSWMRSRLFDPHDAFGLDTISDVMAALMEEWSGKDTSSSSDSSTSPPTTGSTSRGMHSGQTHHFGPGISVDGASSSNGGAAAVSRPTPKH